MWPGTTDASGKYWEVAMSWAEGACLTSYLNKDVDMLEWGCGGRTVLFSKYFVKIVLVSFSIRSSWCTTFCGS